MDIHSRILAACKELTLVHGFQGLRMDELASRAGVSKRTIYRYFPSKEAVIEAALDDFMQQIGAETKQLLETNTDPAQTLADMQKYLLIQGQFAINDKSLHDLQQHFPRLWEKIDRFRSHQLKAVLAYIASSSAPGLAAGIDYPVAETLILAGIQSVINPAFISAHQISFEDAISQVSQILLYGLLPR